MSFSPTTRKQTLNIARFDADGVAFHESDISGIAKMTAAYMGKRHGNELEGTVIWHWGTFVGGKFALGKWYATIGPATHLPTASLSRLHGVLCSEDRMRFAPIMTIAPPILAIKCSGQ